MAEYAALSQSPHALADSLILVFQQPAENPAGGGFLQQVF